jgi:hypothetical protein
MYVIEEIDEETNFFKSIFIFLIENIHVFNKDEELLTNRIVDTRIFLHFKNLAI